MTGTGDPRRLGLAARADALPRLLAWLAEQGGALALPARTQAQLALLAEELFLNAVLHGYRGAPGEVRVVLKTVPGEVELALEDEAPAFDPFATEAVAPASSDPHARPVGRLGLALVQALTCRRSYERAGSTNRVRIALAVESRIASG